VFTAGIGALYLRHMYRRLILPGLAGTTEHGDRRAAGREFWSFAAPRALGSALQVALLWLDVILLAALRGPTEAGVYSAAIRYLALGSLALNAAILVVAPQASALFARGDIRRVADVYKTSTLWLCLLSLPIVSVTAVYSGTLMGAFGHGFAKGAPALTILSAAMAVSILCGPVNTVLLMGGGSLLNLFNIFIGVALNVGLNLFLIPRYGFNGAAVAWAIAIVITNLIPLGQVYRRWSIHPGSRGLFAVSALALGVFIGVGAAARSAMGENVASLVVAVVAGTLLYLAGLWRIRDLAGLDHVGGAIRTIPGGMRFSRAVSGS
jgi:O-antigen/teichoic acid export membrane protein